VKAARFRVGAFVVLAFVVMLAGSIRQAVAAAPSLVVSQVYGGGGNAGAILTNDFIEVFNRGGTTVDVSGWSVQYASAAGTTWQTTALTGSIPAGGHYLIQEAAGAGGTDPLPTPDATGSIAMSATSGKVILSSSATALSGSCPTGAGVIDTVGYGTADCFEGPAARPGSPTRRRTSAGRSVAPTPARTAPTSRPVRRSPATVRLRPIHASPRRS
jgi:uncharacterized protein